MTDKQSATHESSTSRNELERLWNAVKHVAGWQWDYEAVPFDEVMSRPRYSHLKCALAAAAAQLFIQSENAESDAMQDVWSSVRLKAEGADWDRDHETLAEWVWRKL
jgi:hypothetical protein